MKPKCRMFQTPSGSKYYYNKYDQLHRVNGPAVEVYSGYKEWRINDQLHRDHGPAVIDSYSKRWYKRGMRHNEDGPAVVYHDGSMRLYYLNDNVCLYPHWKVMVWYMKLQQLGLEGIMKLLFFESWHYFLFAFLAELNMGMCIHKLYWKDAWLFGIGAIVMTVLGILSSKKLNRYV